MQEGGKKKKNAATPTILSPKKKQRGVLASGWAAAGKSLRSIETHGGGEEAKLGIGEKLSRHKTRCGANF